MKRINFKVPFYNVTITLVKAEKADDYQEIKKTLKHCHIEEESLNDIADAVKNGASNGGDTFRDFRYKRMLVFFYPFDNEDDKIEVYGHEKRHVEDRIMEYFGVDDVESAGMLAGFLSVKFHKFMLL